MNHVELSQVNFGLILRGEKSPQNYVPDWFFGAYADAVDYMKKHPDWCKEDLYGKGLITPSFIQDAEHITSSLNGEGKGDWGNLLRQSNDDMLLKDLLERTARNIARGKPTNYSQLYGIIQSRLDEQSIGLTRGCDIDVKNYHPFIRCGYRPFDELLGGIPTDGPIIIYGLTGIGKSHLAANLSSCYLHEHTDHTAGVYTLEMSAEHWKWRELNMYPQLKEVMDRLFISGSVKDADELSAEISTKGLKFVVIDDLNGLARENSAAEFERVYKKVKELCRFLKIPILVLAQPNREGKKSNKFLGRYDIAWSGAAEDSAAMLIAIQRANELDMDYEDGAAPYPLLPENHEYLIVHKSRDGWLSDYPERYPDKKDIRGPGAIVLKQGKSLWNGEMYGNKLWQPHVVRTAWKKKKEDSNLKLM